MTYTDTTLWYDVEMFHNVDTILAQGITFDQSTSPGPRELFQCEINKYLYTSMTDERKLSPVMWRSNCLKPMLLQAV